MSPLLKFVQGGRTATSRRERALHVASARITVDEPIVAESGFTMSWDSGYVVSLSPGNAITFWYWFKDFASRGAQIARPMPELLAQDERTGSDFGFLDCRLVASNDAIERKHERHVVYSVTVTQDPTLGGKTSRPLFRLIGGGVA